MAKGVVIGGLNNGGGSNIKSTQRGTSTTIASLTQNIAISSIDVANSVVLITIFGTGNPHLSTLMGRLTSATNLEISKYSATSGSMAFTWQVIEFKNLKSLQSGQRIQPNNTPVDVTISAVDPSKSIVFSSFKNSNDTTSTSGMVALVSLTNATTLRLENGNTTEKTFQWYVVEFN